MGVLDGLRGPVGKLLTSFGAEVTIREYAGNYDPSLGANHLTPTDTVIRALVEDYPARDSLGGNRNEGGIARGDKKVTIAGNAVATAPTIKTKVLIGGALYQVVKVDEQLGTDEPVTYTLQVRR